MFTEDMAPKVLPRSGYAKDSVEVEGYVRGFSRRRPDVRVTTLRFANFIGPTVRTPLTEYFTLPVLPIVLGHDAGCSVHHEDDGLAALRRATVEDRPGTFNVAGDGYILSRQAARQAGRPVLPVPGLASSMVGGLMKRAKLADFSPEQIRFLTYGRGVDTTECATSSASARSTRPPRRSQRSSTHVAATASSTATEVGSVEQMLVDARRTGSDG